MVPGAVLVPSIYRRRSVLSNLQLLVFKLALQLLRFGNLADSLVEIILVDGVPVILDCEETAAGKSQYCSFE